MRSPPALLASRPRGGPEPAEEFENPFRGRLLLLEDIQCSADLLRQVLPLRDLLQSSPSTPWWHRGVNVRLGSILVNAGIMPGARLVTTAQDALTGILGWGGEQRVRQGSRDWWCRQDGCLLLPGEPFGWECMLASFLMFRLEQERLLRTAMAMAGLSDPPASWKEEMQHPHLWASPPDSGDPPLQDLLRQEMLQAGRLAGHAEVLGERLQMDDRIYRLLAAMLLPEVQEERHLDRLTQRSLQGRDSFDELIDFIRLNLSQPLNLTQLEAHSHYSRRALQYAFRERLGCTATQWIRSQRLDLARGQLERPAPGDTVASIAAACGYRSLSLFSVDFQHRFHVKPSQLLREARSSLPLPAEATAGL